MTVDEQELNQENYKLKLRLDAVTAECQLTKVEHQTDIDSLKRQLADEQRRAQSRERADRQTIEELTAHSERLAEQLLNVSAVVCCLLRTSYGGSSLNKHNTSVFWSSIFACNFSGWSLNIETYEGERFMTPIVCLTIRPSFCLSVCLVCEL